MRHVVKQNVVKPFRRTGMHRLNCTGCPAYVYATVAMLETHGFPVCACGRTFEPERLELALMLDVETAATIAYAAKVSSVAHGQAWTGRSGLAQPEQRAFEQIHAEQRRESRERRLAALKPTPEPMPF